MKSPLHFAAAFLLTFPLRLLSAAMLVALLTGCGQTGPLYLGTPPPPHPVRNAPADEAMPVAPPSGASTGIGVTGAVVKDSK